MITPVLINRIDWATYIIFTITNAAFVPIVYFFYPGKTYCRDVDFRVLIKA